MNEKDIDDKRCFKYISMHFRIGDYTAPQHRDAHPVLECEYYKRAFESVLSNIPRDDVMCVFFTFVKQDQEHVEQIIDVLMMEVSKGGIAFERVNYDIPDWEQMLMMSCCDYHIIANSSFSWWELILIQIKTESYVILISGLVQLCLS